MEVFDFGKLQLTIDEVAALRDYCGLSSTKMRKLKQALEIFIPELKGLVFPPAIQKKLTDLERDGNLPVNVRKLPLIIKSDGAKVDLRIVWWLL